MSHFIASSLETMPKLLASVFQIDNPQGISINEYLGSASEDRVSVAVMKVNEPTHLPWMQNEYEEWISVLKGRVIVMDSEGNHFDAVAGQTVHVALKERFRTIYPDKGTEYIAICMPGFRLDRNHPEDESAGVDPKVLKLLDSSSKSASGSNTTLEPVIAETEPDIIYHMCPKEVWEAAKRAGGAYFPASFVKDGYFIHATAVPEMLIATANHFYQDSIGDWICLRLSRAALYQRGIIVKYEDAAPVSDKAVNPKHSRVLFPHIYGGIPMNGVVDAEFPIVREGPRFISISGV